ncbi:monooxygenase 2-like isoform X2 [Papaver somniferum]|uniref:monooxygenase 2-like isoform X2 n=1 Tax=Papaver somniferum TaxID=3469 RepID=UPI000E703DEE|nr:monooxygenase 2-like isoform X2 [Papaver somniferum]
MDYQMINNNNNMIEEEDTVIVGAGIAGLATSLGLHSLVLENLRVTGFAFTTFTNAWKALDDLGRLVATSTISGIPTSHTSFTDPQGNSPQEHEIRCVGRKVLLKH